jgi:hypothetical protein
VFPFFVPAPFCLGFFVLQPFLFAISWNCNLLVSSHTQSKEAAARPHSGRRTPAPCLDPSGKQEHRHSRGDAAITRLSSKAPRGSKKQNKQANHKRRKQASKKSKQERRKEEEDDD